MFSRFTGFVIYVALVSVFLGSLMYLLTINVGETTKNHRTHQVSVTDGHNKYVIYDYKKSQMRFYELN